MATNNAGNIPTAATGKILQGQGVGVSLAFSTATYPATAGTSGNVLTSDGTNWNSTAPSGGLSLSIQTLTGNPADGVTYFLGNGTALTGFTASGNATTRLYIPKAGTINICYGANTVAGTLGSGQSATLAIRKNNTTDTNVTTGLTFTAATTTFNNTGLGISVAAGDYLEFKLISPTWTPTNPTTVSLTVTIILS